LTAGRVGSTQSAAAFPVEDLHRRDSLVLTREQDIDPAEPRGGPVGHHCARWDHETQRSSAKAESVSDGGVDVHALHDSAKLPPAHEPGQRLRAGADVEGRERRADRQFMSWSKLLSALSDEFEGHANSVDPGDGRSLGQSTGL
jgi:hypothetical protein